MLKIVDTFPFRTENQKTIQTMNDIDPENIRKCIDDFSGVFMFI